MSNPKLVSISTIEKGPIGYVRMMMAWPSLYAACVGVGFGVMLVVLYRLAHLVAVTAGWTTCIS